MLWELRGEMIKGLTEVSASTASHYRFVSTMKLIAWKDLSLK